MKKFEEPTLEVQTFEVEDVVTTSWTQGEGETERD